MKTLRLSQTEKVLQYLLKGNTISQRKATAYFNIIRLSAIIYNLRSEYGIPVRTLICPNLTHSGSYAKYFIDRDYLKNINKKLENKII